MPSGLLAGCAGMATDAGPLSALELSTVLAAVPVGAG